MQSGAVDRKGQEHGTALYREREERACTGRDDLPRRYFEARFGAVKKFCGGDKQGGHPGPLFVFSTLDFESWQLADRILQGEAQLDAPVRQSQAKGREKPGVG